MSAAALVSRHDLILGDDVVRAMAAANAVDEHRALGFTMGEAAEVFALLGVQFDPAALARAGATDTARAPLHAFMRTLFPSYAASTIARAIAPHIPAVAAPPAFPITPAARTLF